MVAAGPAGRVEPREAGLRWRVVFPDVEHLAASSYLRELAASDCSPATIRNYAYALLRWFRFLHERFVGWERAERGDVRAFVEHLRETPNPQRLRRPADAPLPGSVNPRTGKPSPGGHYAARTINHQLSVLFGSTSTPAPQASGRWSTRSRRSGPATAAGCLPTTIRWRTSWSVGGRPTGRSPAPGLAGDPGRRGRAAVRGCCAATATAP